MTIFFSILHIGLVCAVSLRILARPQLNTHARTAWILVLLVLPLFGLVLYLLIGEIHFSGPERRRTDAAVAATGPAVLASAEAPDLPRWGEASAFATSINGFGVTTGNRAELLKSPEGARRRLVEDMDAATATISVLYYIWLDDETGLGVADALIRAAKRGVRCRVMADAIGSRAFIASDMWQRFKDAGVETSVALPVRNPLRTRFYRRPALRHAHK